MKGSNTNNYVEAQFLVVRDIILRRQRQYNINQLLDKLIIEFENHFKQRLLRVANGTFDGVFSATFKGLFVKTTPGRFLPKSCKRNNVLAIGFIFSLKGL